MEAAGGLYVFQAVLQVAGCRSQYVFTAVYSGPPNDWLHALQLALVIHSTLHTSKFHSDFELNYTCAMLRALRGMCVALYCVARYVTFIVRYERVGHSLFFTVIVLLLQCCDLSLCWQCLPKTWTIAQSLYYLTYV